MASKRKRDEFSDSDSDEITPGKQILPVANLPYDFDQEPQDGMQYLFLVRRDARRLPHVTRVRNPYEVPATGIVHTHTSSSTSVPLPCEEWRVTFQTRFSNLRKNLSQSTIHIGHDQRRQVMPEKKDRDAWWKYLAGHPESAWRPRDRSVRKKLGTSSRLRASIEPDEVVLAGDAARLHTVLSKHEFSQPPISCSYDSSQNVGRQPSAPDVLQNAESPGAPSLMADPLISEQVQGEHIRHLLPRDVTPLHLREIDHRMSIHLLMYFTHWINVHLQNPDDPLTTISINHAQWIFALLTKVEDQLSADEMNLLRNLARACLQLIQGYRGKEAVFEADSGSGWVTRMSDASCWMVFTAIAGYWGQRDLWADAETILASDLD